MRKITLSLIPRILGLMDRESDSETYGCFDRNYWCYKIHDYVNIRFQEATHILALLYKYNFKGNIYYNNKKIREWLQAGVDFYFKKQSRDGSYDEVYPYEHSFCATSFSTANVTNAIILCDLNFDRKKLIKTGIWISKNDSYMALNQSWISLLALYNIYKLTQDEKIKEAFEKKLEYLKNMKCFYEEYGGFDIGYSSITLSCMMQLYEKIGDNKIKEMALELAARIDPHIDEYGKFDFSKTSRKTQFLYPYGFYSLKNKTFDSIKNGLKQNKIINPTWMDDRYMLLFCLDYILVVKDG